MSVTSLSNVLTIQLRLDTDGHPISVEGRVGHYPWKMTPSSSVFLIHMHDPMRLHCQRGV